MIINVKSCKGCPFWHFMEGFTKDSHYCEILHKETSPKGGSMPKWCPLNDMPITVKHGNKMMVEGGYASKSFEESVNQINKALNQ